jgi:hypothetical protein
MSLVNPYPLSDICNIKLHLSWSAINRVFETYNLLFVILTVILFVTSRPFQRILISRNFGALILKTFVVSHINEYEH